MTQKADIQVVLPYAKDRRTIQEERQQPFGGVSTNLEETMFDLDQFVTDCRDALAANSRTSSFVKSFAEL
jgi:hypothetical protein